MSVNLVISENCYISILLNYKELPTIIAIITESEVSELLCITDYFCKLFDEMIARYTLKSDKKLSYHRDFTMSKTEIMLITILFHHSGYRCLKHFYLDKIRGICIICFQMPSHTTGLLNLKKMWRNLWHYSSSLCCSGNAQASVSWTVPLWGCIETSGHISIRCSMA